MTVELIDMAGENVRSSVREHFQQVFEIPVTVVMASAQRLSCRAFVRAVSRYGSRPEMLIERLNDPETRFLVFTSRDHKRMINLKWVSVIEFAGRSSEVARRIEEQGNREKIEIAFNNGETIVSDVLYGLPKAKSRISDLLNSDEDRFLLLFDGFVTRFVNRDAIAWVHHVGSSSWQQ